MEKNNRNYGNFNNLEEFIIALKAFSEKVDKYGQGIPYSTFTRETGVSRKHIEYYVKKHNIKKIKARKKKMPNIGKFNSYDEFEKAVIEFSSKKDENGKNIPYSVFAKDNNIVPHIVYGVAARKCKRRYSI